MRLIDAEKTIGNKTNDKTCKYEYWEWPTLGQSDLAVCDGYNKREMDLPEDGE